MALSIGDGLLLATLVLGAHCSRNSPPLPDVSLSPITAGYLVCSPRPLHACRARSVDPISIIDFLPTDIAASPSCAAQEKLATQHCAGVGRPYDADNVKCLAGQGVLINRFSDPEKTVRRGDNEPYKLTLRCAEGQTSIDVIIGL